MGDREDGYWGRPGRWWTQEYRDGEFLSSGGGGGCLGMVLLGLFLWLLPFFIAAMQIAGAAWEFVAAWLPLAAMLAFVCALVGFIPFYIAGKVLVSGGKPGLWRALAGAFAGYLALLLLMPGSWGIAALLDGVWPRLREAMEYEIYGWFAASRFHSIYAGDGVTAAPGITESLRTLSEAGQDMVARWSARVLFYLPAFMAFALAFCWSARAPGAQFLRSFGIGIVVCVLLVVTTLWLGDTLLVTAARAMNH